MNLKYFCYLNSIVASAPCRAVQMTAAALGLELNLIHTSLDKNEHMTPAFLKACVKLK